MKINEDKIFRFVMIGGGIMLLLIFITFINLWQHGESVVSLDRASWISSTSGNLIAYLAIVLGVSFGMMFLLSKIFKKQTFFEKIVKNPFHYFGGAITALLLTVPVFLILFVAIPSGPLGVIMGLFLKLSIILGYIPVAIISILGLAPTTELFAVALIPLLGGALLSSIIGGLIAIKFGGKVK